MNEVPPSQRTEPRKSNRGLMMIIWIVLLIILVILGFQYCAVRNSPEEIDVIETERVIPPANP